MSTPKKPVIHVTYKQLKQLIDALEHFSGIVSGKYQNKSTPDSIPEFQRPNRWVNNLSKDEKIQLHKKLDTCISNLNKKKANDQDEILDIDFTLPDAFKIKVKDQKDQIKVKDQKDQFEDNVDGFIKYLKQYGTQRGDTPFGLEKIDELVTSLNRLAATPTQSNLAGPMPQFVSTRSAVPPQPTVSPTLTATHGSAISFSAPHPNFTLSMKDAIAMLENYLKLQDILKPQDQAIKRNINFISNLLAEFKKIKQADSNKILDIMMTISESDRSDFHKKLLHNSQELDTIKSFPIEKFHNVFLTGIYSLAFQAGIDVSNLATPLHITAQDMTAYPTVPQTLTTTQGSAISLSASAKNRKPDSDIFSGNWDSTFDERFFKKPTTTAKGASSASAVEDDKSDPFAKLANRKSNVVSGSPPQRTAQGSDSPEMTFAGSSPSPIQQMQQADKVTQNPDHDKLYDDFEEEEEELSSRSANSKKPPASSATTDARTSQWYVPPPPSKIRNASENVMGVNAPPIKTATPSQGQSSANASHAASNQQRSQQATTGNANQARTPASSSNSSSQPARLKSLQQTQSATLASSGHSQTPMTFSKHANSALDSSAARPSSPNVNSSDNVYFTAEVNTATEKPQQRLKAIQDEFRKKPLDDQISSKRPYQMIIDAPDENSLSVKIPRADMDSNVPGYKENPGYDLIKCSVKKQNIAIDVQVDPRANGMPDGRTIIELLGPETLKPLQVAAGTKPEIIINLLIAAELLGVKKESIVVTDEKDIIQSHFSAQYKILREREEDPNCSREEAELIIEQIKKGTSKIDNFIPKVSTGQKPN